MFRRRPIPVLTEDFIQRKARFSILYAFTGFSLFGILFAGLVGRNSWWNPLSTYFPPQPNPSGGSAPPIKSPYLSKPLIYVNLKEAIEYEAQKKRLKQEKERLRRKLAYKLAEEKARADDSRKPTVSASDLQIQPKSDSLKDSSISK